MGRGIPRDDYAAAVEMYRSVAVDIESARIENKIRSRRVPPPSQSVLRDAEGDVPMSGVNTMRTRGGSNKQRNSRRPRAA
jgi:hypothetical protein